jgi:hypothetical protein
LLSLSLSSSSPSSSSSTTTTTKTTTITIIITTSATPPPPPPTATTASHLELSFFPVLITSIYRQIILTSTCGHPRPFMVSGTFSILYKLIVSSLFSRL